MEDSVGGLLNPPFSIFHPQFRTPGAIWRAHQAGEMAADFDSLFELLSRRPDVEMRFAGEVV